MGIELAPDDVVFRMNLVSLKPGADGALVMDDFTSGHITSEEAARDRRRSASRTGRRRYRVPQRRQLSPSDGLARRRRDRLTPPHDITGKPVEPHLPQGEGADRLRKLMDRAAAILREHPVNRARRGEASRRRPRSGSGGRASVPPCRR